jgi:hypothetical protein
MLKDRGHKGSWKGSSNQSRTKKKSYGNIHSINDRGIHEIYESIGNSAGRVVGINRLIDSNKIGGGNCEAIFD